MSIAGAATADESIAGAATADEFIADAALAVCQRFHSFTVSQFHNFTVSFSFFFFFLPLLFFLLLPPFDVVTPSKVAGTESVGAEVGINQGPQPPLKRGRAQLAWRQLDVPLAPVVAALTRAAAGVPSS